MTNNYHQKHKEKLQKEALKKYQNLSEEEKDKRQKKAGERYQNFTEEKKEKKRQNHRKRNKNISEEQKQKLVEYRGNYYIAVGPLCRFFKDPGTIKFFIS